MLFLTKCAPIFQRNKTYFIYNCKTSKLKVCFSKDGHIIFSVQILLCSLSVNPLGIFYQAECCFCFWSFKKKNNDKISNVLWGNIGDTIKTVFFCTFEQYFKLKKIDISTLKYIYIYVISLKINIYAYVCLYISLHLVQLV